MTVQQTLIELSLPLSAWSMTTKHNKATGRPKARGELQENEFHFAEPKTRSTTNDCKKGVHFAFTLWSLKKSARHDLKGTDDWHICYFAN